MTRIAEFTVSSDLLIKVRGASAAERRMHRLHCVVLVANGLSASEAARIFGDSPRAVAYWVTRYRKMGLKGLEEESRPGRPSRLNSSEIKKLDMFVSRSRARSQVVNANVLTKYIKTTFGVTLTDRQCWRILKRLDSSSG
jgi:transposase